MNELYKEYTQLITEKNIKELSFFARRREVEELAEVVSDDKKLLDESTEILKSIKSRINEEKANEQKSLLEAKNLSDGFHRDDEGFHKFRESYDNLGNDFAELTTEKDRLKVKINALSTANDGELEQYERQLVEMTRLEHLLVSSNNQFKNFAERITDQRIKLTEDLNGVIQRIDGKFGAFFRRLNCLGEVSLYTGK